MGKIKDLWNKFIDFRMDMRKIPAYCVFERAMRVGVLGCIGVVLAQFTLGAEWSVPFLKATILAGVLAGVDKFKNVLRESDFYSMFNKSMS